MLTLGMLAGALPPLCVQLSAALQSDGRSRAAALSAIANVSFVDSPALVSAGAAPRLCEVLFETDAALLRMALTTLFNLLMAPPPR